MRQWNLDGLKRERQKYRDKKSGRYAEVARCEICGKSVGLNYYSLPDCNQTGFGVVVHRECAEDYERKGQRKEVGEMLKATRISVDEEYNAEEWWTAAQTPEAIEAAPAAIRPILTGEAEEVIVSAVEERQILTWAATLPGWADGPEYARYPLLANPVE